MGTFHLFSCQDAVSSGSDATKSSPPNQVWGCAAPWLWVSLLLSVFLSLVIQPLLTFCELPEIFHFLLQLTSQFLLSGTRTLLIQWYSRSMPNWIARPYWEALISSIRSYPFPHLRFSCCSLFHSSLKFANAVESNGACLPSKCSFVIMTYNPKTTEYKLVK